MEKFFTVQIREENSQSGNETGSYLLHHTITSNFPAGKQFTHLGMKTK